MQRLFLSLILSLLAVSARTSDLTTVAYRPTDDDIINPERGMFSHREFFSGRSDELDLDFLDAERDAGRSLVFTVYVMRDFRDKEISKPFLNKLRRNLENIRRAGMKAVLRFCYSFSEQDHPWDAPMELTERHIEQLTPILQNNSDVIAVLEAGFVGVWGEWYYTDNHIFEPKSDQYGPRRNVLDKLLQALPKDRFVSVRTPLAKLCSFGITPNDTLTFATAHNGSDFSRIGFHNDCFLASADDFGTFGDVPERRHFWMRDSRFVPMGGETCGMSEFCDVDNAARDFANYHWSYLNKDYHPDVLGKWAQEFFMPEVQKKLGYRLVLKKGAFTANPAAGGNMHAELDIANEGWAAPFNPRDVELVLVKKKGGTKYRAKLPDDPRFWLSGTTTTVTADIALPADMPPGEYDLFLNLPDPAPRLNKKAEYSIRLANDKVWKPKQGYNLLHTLKIGGPNGSDTPAPDALPLQLLK